MMESKEKNFVSAVIYVHNDAERIGSFLMMVRSVLENFFEHSEIICVNDHSTDGSAEIIRNTGGTGGCSTITLLHMSYYHGLEMAMNAGVDLAIGDFIFEFDSAVSDFCPGEIMEVYRKSLEGFDIVSASPMKKEKLTSRIYYWLFDRASLRPFAMRSERFRILSRRAVNRIGEMNTVIPYRKALYANCGLKTAALSYFITAPGKAATECHDKAERRYRVRLAADTLLLFTDLGYRFSMMMTMLMMLVTIFAGVYSLTVYLAADPVAGWTTTILFLSFAFFGLFGILTVIIKYLQILVDLVFRRKHYSYESIEKLV